MKKLLSILAALILAITCALGLTACGDDAKTIKIGASSAPHAEILEQVKDDLKAKGFNLEIKIYDDYVLPNTAVNDGSLFANYFQHKPYLDSFNQENGTKIVSVADIHYEPLGIYGKDTVKTGKTILIPNDASNGTRALFLLQQEGYVTLKEGVKNTDTLSVLDVVDAKGNTVTPVTAGEIPAQYKAGNANTIAVVNGNYALSAELSVTERIGSESATGYYATTYANIIAVKEGNENDPRTKALIEVLKTKKVADYINTKYKGTVQPSFTVND